MILDEPETLIANSRYGGYSNDYSAIGNGNSNGLSSNHLYDNHSSPNITPIATDNIRTWFADTNISESARDSANHKDKTLAPSVSNCSNNKLNGLYLRLGYRNGYVKYTECISNTATIYCNPKSGWPISYDNAAYYYPYPFTDTPATVNNLIFTTVNTIYFFPIYF